MYCERLEFFVANDIGQCTTDALAGVIAGHKRKEAIMISIIGKNA